MLHGLILKVIKLQLPTQKHFSTAVVKNILGGGIVRLRISTCRWPLCISLVVDYILTWILINLLDTISFSFTYNKIMSNLVSNTVYQNHYLTFSQTPQAQSVGYY